MFEETSVWAEAFRCGFADWQQIWGDPLLSGTLLFLGYLLAGIYAWRVSRQMEGRERILWRLCAALMLFQAINTPLDLHAFVWTFGRCLSRLQGWYANRQAVQLLLLFALAFAGLALVMILCFFFRWALLRNSLLILGVLISLIFTAVKGVSLHDLADLYGVQLGSLYVADVIELVGIALVLLASWLRAFGNRNPHNRPIP